MAHASEIALLLGVAALACQAEPEGRFAPLDDSCGGRPCEISGGGGGIVGGGLKGVLPDGGAGSPDAGNSDSDDSPTRFEASIGIAASVDLQTVVGLGNVPVELTAWDADGGQRTLSYQEPDPLILELVLPARLLLQTDASERLRPTIQWVRQASPPVELLLLEDQVLRDIVSNLNSALIDEAAHAMLEFVTKEGAPLADVSVILPTAQRQALVAYDIGVFFSDADDKTNERGAAVLINLDARSLVGGDIEFDVTYGATRRTITLFVAPGAVTLDRIVL